MKKPILIAGEYPLLNGYGEFAYYTNESKFITAMPKEVSVMIYTIDGKYEPLADVYTNDGRFDSCDNVNSLLNLMELGNE